MGPGAPRKTMELQITHHYTLGKRAGWPGIFYFSGQMKTQPLRFLSGPEPSILSLLACGQGPRLAPSPHPWKAAAPAFGVGSDSSGFGASCRFANGTSTNPSPLPRALSLPPSTASPASPGPEPGRHWLDGCHLYTGASQGAWLFHMRAGCGLSHKLCGFFLFHLLREQLKHFIDFVPRHKL